MTRDPKARRIVIALDPAGPHAEALEAVLCFTDDTPSETLGVYIEDQEMLAISQSSMAQEFTRAGTERRLSHADLLRQLRVRAEAVRASFETGAKRLALPHSFEVLQGHVLEELERLQQRCDILIIARSGRRAGIRSWYGAPLHRLAAGTAETTVIVQDHWNTGSAIAVIRDGADPERKALARAESMARANRLELVLLVPEAELRDAPCDTVADAGEHPIRRRYVGVHAFEGRELERVLRRAQARAIVIRQPVDEPTRALIDELLRSTESSLVLVR